MSKIIPITEKQLIRFQNTFYKFDEMSFAEIDSIEYCDWVFYDDVFYEMTHYKECKIYLDTSPCNEILYFDIDIVRKVVRKILK